MDELLDLLNDAPPVVAIPDTETRTELSEEFRARPSENIERHVHRESAASQERSSTIRQQGRNLAQASVDDTLGIRMSNRLISSNDLSEMIQDYAYFSPPILSAMTLRRLNSLLVDPSPLVDAATVAGKTENLFTVGVVFSNSGTKISSKGGAFCVLTIGNMNSGPCVSIFLFGEAYGKYCVTCKPGKVISLMAPNLLPAKRENSNGKHADNGLTVSFSVRDVGQLRIVASARDYGICKASSASGHSCKNFVDKRHSEYCKFHLQAQKRAAKGGGKQAVNKFQQVKAAHQQAAPMVVMAARKRNLVGVTPANKSNRFLNDSTNRTTTVINSLKKTPSKIGRGRNMPMHTTKNATMCDRKPNNNRRTATFEEVSKKHMAKRAARSAETISHSTQIPRSNNPSLGEDWLEDATSSARKKGPAHICSRAGLSLAYFTKKRATAGTNKTAATPKRKSAVINTAGMNFDGSVSIPKPNKLFQQASTPVDLPTRRTITPTTDVSARMEELRSQQAEVAIRLKEGHTEQKPKPSQTTIRSRLPCGMPRKGATSRPPKKIKKNEEVDNFLAAMGGEINEDKIRSAKSQFANEVDAEEYAIRRRKLLELEKLEASQESRKKKQNPQNGTKEMKMTKSWVCKTCRRSFSLKPSRCIMAQHNVKTNFAIKQSLSKDQRKNELHKKSAADGGLQLGSGIEWNSNGFNRFTN